MSELYLAMGRLICAFVLIVGVLAALWLAVGLTANWGQKRIDEAAERRHSDYRRVAARHGQNPQIKKSRSRRTGQRK